MNTNLMFWLGAAVVLIACLTPLIRPRTPTAQTVTVALCGLVMVVLSDSGVSNFKCNLSEGCGWERTGVSAADQIKGLIGAETDTKIIGLSAELTPKFKEINTAIQQLQDRAKNGNAPAAAPLAPAPLPSSTVAVPLPASSSDRGAVLVYFRDGQEQRANSIVEALRKSGFASTAVNSSLREISQWARRAETGFVQVAVAGDNSALASELRDIITPIVKSNALAVDNGWSFRASKAQIYLF